MMHVVLLIAVIVAALVYITTKNRKDEKVAMQLAEKEAVHRMESILIKLADADKLAGSTPRIALSGPVKALQDLAREAESASVTTCVAPARDKLVKGIRLTADRYLAFMRQETDDSHVQEVMDTLILAKRQMSVCITP